MMLLFFFSVYQVMKRKTETSAHHVSHEAIHTKVCGCFFILITRHTFMLFWIDQSKT